MRRPSLRDVRDEAGRLGGAVIQVLSFNAGPTAAQDSNFVLLDFEEKLDRSPIVFVEGLTASLYLERRAGIDRYREVIGYLRDSALSPSESVRHITDMRNHYAHD